MKRYKLLKDIPTHKAGTIFRLSQQGNLVGKKGILYDKTTLDKHPHILKDWFERVAEVPKTVWDLKVDDEYFWLNGSEATRMFWRGDEEDKADRECGNVLLTREDAEQELARRKAKQILLRDTKGFIPDWKKNDYGVAVWWDVLENKLLYNWADYNDGTLRFRNDVDAEASIKTHQKEWKIYLGVEE